jgi:hypothetical protein
VLVAWTPLSPSRREQGLRRVAQALGWSTAALLFGAAVRDGSIEPVPALAALLAAVGGLLAGHQPPRERIEVGIDDSGCMAVRRVVVGAGDSPEQRPQCIFAAPWLITLKSGTMWVRIWPDSVPGNIFRRLWVHMHWNPSREPADRTGATAPGPSG